MKAQSKPVRQQSDWQLYRRLLRQARPYWPHVGGIFALSLLSTPLALLSPVPMKILVDSVIGSHPLPGFIAATLPAGIERSPGALLALACALVILVALASQLQSLASWLLQTYTGEKLVLDFRAQLFRHAQQLSFSYHDTKGASDSAFRIQYDSSSIQYIIINGIIPLISAMMMLVSMIYVTAKIDRDLVLVALSVSPLLFVFTRVFGRKVKRRWKDLKAISSLTNAIVQEVLSSMRVVKAFGREEHEQSRFMVQSNQRVRLQISTYLLQGSYDLLVGLSIAVGTSAVLYFGVMHVRSGVLTLGELLIVVGYVGQLFDPLRVLSKKLTDLQANLASAERAFALLDEMPEVVERPDARHLERSAGRVTFSGVGFAYRKGHPVLSDVSLDVPSGSRVGIQGETGAGKTTLLSLLIRFYDVTEGQILIDDVDIRDYRIDDLRNQFGIVLQEPVLFSASLAENIAYGRLGSSQEEIVEAARLANAHTFIERLPDGYDTQVGERGMQLSGGERQRISLARAFLRDAPILILDEPTSSVDTATEELIMEAMERLMKGRTTFIIAHRLTTLKNCDLRVEMRAGHLAHIESSVLPPLSAVGGG